MRRFMTALTLICALMSSAAEARWGVGNGGDELRLAFVSARTHAANIALRLEDRSLPMNLAPSLRQWILDNHAELAADIARSEHAWTLDEEETCAWTQPTSAATVQLSFPTCREAIASADGAGQLLVHESVHHFGVTDETFADAVAMSIYDAWRSGATDWVSVTGAGAPDARQYATATWTGSEVIVFGGVDGNGYTLASGGRYDPQSDTWKSMSTRNAPARINHQAMWTGDKLIVWGGYIAHGSSNVWQNSGAIWDPATDTWQELATPYGPTELADLAISERAIQTVTWTGSELIVFGGAPLKGVMPGGIYNPATNTWRPLSLVSAPLRLAGHSAVWADDRLIVWGGLDLARNRTNTGAAFDPVANTWTALSTTAAPLERDGHTAVWTGSQMIVFGGFDPTTDPNGTGGVYDLASNAWSPLRTESVQARLGHTAVWTGSEMLIFGGKSKRFQSNLFNAVSAYNPANKSWRIVDSASAPSPRAQQAGVWTGASLVIFGGKLLDGQLANSGGVFYP